MKIVKDPKPKQSTKLVVFKYNKHKNICYIQHKNKVENYLVKGESNYYYFVYNLLSCKFYCLNLVNGNPSPKTRVSINQIIRTLNHYINGEFDKETRQYKHDGMYHELTLMSIEARRRERAIDSFEILEKCIQKVRIAAKNKEQTFNNKKQNFEKWVENTQNEPQLSNSKDLLSMQPIQDTLETAKTL